MRNNMVDLETLGKVPGCAILSIGVVAFAFGHVEHGEEIMDSGFYTVVNRQSCFDNFLHSDPETMTWWDDQSEAARVVLHESMELSKSTPLPDALDALNAYVTSFGGKDARVWGNGSDFDNAILAAAFHACGKKPAWNFWNNRCYRTLKNLDMRGTKAERVGTYHNALDDAKTQALHARQIARDLDLTGIN